MTQSALQERIGAELQDFAEEEPENAVAAHVIHPEEELMAQSICTSITGVLGWTYAVQRACTSTNTETCASICLSQNLRSQDPQTSSKTWFAAAAIHVYKNRPSSGPGTVSNPQIGLKVYRYGNLYNTGCGPNFCCCHALPYP